MNFGEHRAMMQTKDLVIAGNGFRPQKMFKSNVIAAIPKEEASQQSHRKPIQKCEAFGSGYIFLLHYIMRLHIITCSQVTISCMNLHCHLAFANGPTLMS